MKRLVRLGGTVIVLGSTFVWMYIGTHFPGLFSPAFSYAALLFVLLTLFLIVLLAFVLHYTHYHPEFLPLSASSPTPIPDPPLWRYARIIQLILYGGIFIELLAFSIVIVIGAAERVNWERGLESSSLNASNWDSFLDEAAESNGNDEEWPQWHRFTSAVVAVDYAVFKDVKEKGLPKRDYMMALAPLFFKSLQNDSTSAWNATTDEVPAWAVAYRMPTPKPKASDFWVTPDVIKEGFVSKIEKASRAEELAQEAKRKFGLRLNSKLLLSIQGASLHEVVEIAEKAQAVRLLIAMLLVGLLSSGIVCIDLLPYMFGRTQPAAAAVESAENTAEEKKYLLQDFRGATTTV